MAAVRGSLVLQRVNDQVRELYDLQRLQVLPFLGQPGGTSRSRPAEW